MSAHDVKEKDQLGKFPRILINPVYKDTITVRGKGSYTIIRFKATNPGKSQTYSVVFKCTLDSFL